MAKKFMHRGRHAAHAAESFSDESHIPSHEAKVDSKHSRAEVQQAGAQQAKTQPTSQPTRAIPHQREDGGSPLRSSQIPPIGSPRTQDARAAEATTQMPREGQAAQPTTQMPRAEQGAQPTTQMPRAGQTPQGAQASEETTQFRPDQTRQMNSVSGFASGSRAQSYQEAPMGVQANSRAQQNFDGIPYGQTATKEYNKMHHRKIRRIILVILAILVAIYLIGVAVFSFIFYPNTRMGTQDVSLQPASNVSQMATKLGSNYSIHVSGEGLDFTLSSNDLGMNIDGNAVANEALSMNSAWEWPVQLFLSHDVSEALSNGINANGVKRAVNAQVDAYNQKATDPVDATIVYSKQVSSFVVQPEQAGTKLDNDAVLQTVDKSVADMQNTATITDAQLIQPNVVSTDSRLKDAADQANKYIKSDIKLTMGKNNTQVAEITPSDIAQWVTLDDNLTPSFNDDDLTQWVSNFASKVNTVGSERTYTRPDGQKFTVSGGTYGWEVDNDSLVSKIKDAIDQGTSTTIDVPTSHEAYQYSGQGKQDFGRYIDVDLTKQHAIAYDENGNKIWKSDVVTGKPDPDHATPEGVWTLFNKESPSVLKGQIDSSTGEPEYETKVDYWMAFTDYGDGLHDAVWQTEFGGTRYKDGYGSHGCINLSHDAAAALYDVINVGNAVVIHN